MQRMLQLPEQLHPVSVCSGNILKQLIQKDYFLLHTYFGQPMRFGRK